MAGTRVINPFSSLGWHVTDALHSPIPAVTVRIRNMRRSSRDPCVLLIACDLLAGSLACCWQDTSHVEKTVSLVDNPAPLAVRNP